MFRSYKRKPRGWELLAVLPHVEGHLATCRGPSCPMQRAVLPQAEGRLAPSRGPSCPMQRAILPHAEGHLAPCRGPSCPKQRAVLPQAEGHLAPCRGPSCPKQRAVLPQGWDKSFFRYSCYFSNAAHLSCQFAENNFLMGNTHICLQYEHIKYM